MEVLSKKLHYLGYLWKFCRRSGILTSFGPIQAFLETFVMSKEISLSGTIVINSIFHGNYPNIHNAVV